MLSLKIPQNDGVCTMIADPSSDISRISVVRTRAIRGRNRKIPRKCRRRVLFSQKTMDFAAASPAPLPIRPQNPRFPAKFV